MSARIIREVVEVIMPDGAKREWPAELHERNPFRTENWLDVNRLRPIDGSGYFFVETIDGNWIAIEEQI